MLAGYHYLPSPRTQLLEKEINGGNPAFSQLLTVFLLPSTESSEGATM
jgi:hypothetical protein